MKTTKNILMALVMGAPLIFASSAGASGAPAMGSFSPVSVSFVSASRGFVLGTSPCAHAPCTSVLTTGNGGASWLKRAALPAPVPNPAASESPSGVSEIAFEVGFQSLTHFNRVFKKILGQSPTQYRAQLLGTR